MATRKEANEARRENLTGFIFGRLSVQSFIENSKKWLCTCLCGKEVLVPSERLKSGNTKSCGCYQKERASAAAKEQHKRVRVAKGLPEEYTPRRSSEVDRMEFSKLSRKILERDGFSCVWCEKRGGKLAAHHLEKWEANKNSRFLRENLVTLCYSCHLKIHKNNYHASVEPIMTIILTGYARQIEAICSRIEVT